MDKLKALKSFQQRSAVGAILGSVVADAAARPLHWNYDQSKLNELVKEKPDYGFYPKSECPFYTTRVGRNSTYGDITLTTLISLARTNGQLNIKDWRQCVTEVFGTFKDLNSSDYQDAKQLRDDLSSARERSKRILLDNGIKVGDDHWQEFFPAAGPWINHTIQEFLEKYKENSSRNDTGIEDSEDNDSYGIAITYVSLLASGAIKSDDDEKSNNNKDLSFPNDKIKSFMNELIINKDVISRSLLLSNLLWDIVISTKEEKNVSNYFNVRDWINKRVETLNDDDIVKKELKAVTDAIDEKTQDPTTLRHIKVTDKFGKACGNPGSFQAPLHNILLFEKNGRSESFKDVLLHEIVAGGDNCSRSIVTGSIMGAILGVNALPKDWIEKCENRNKGIINLLSLLETNINANNAFVAKQAILGGIIGDSASIPLHWVYDVEALEGYIDGISDFSFFNENKCPFYTMDNGDNSFYGDIFKTAIGSVVKNNGIFDHKTFLNSLVNTFGKDSNYAKVQAIRDAQKDDKNKERVKGGWFGGHMKKTIAIIEKGETKNTSDPENHDNDGIVSIFGVILTMFSFGNGNKVDSKLIDQVVSILITDKDTKQRSIAFGEILLSLLNCNSTSIINRKKLLFDNLLNIYDKTSDNGIIEKLSKVPISDHSKNALITGKEKWGHACGQPGSLRLVIHNLYWYCKNGNGNYKNTILREIRAGGDSCARSLICGTLISVVEGNGLANIPADWVGKCNSVDECCKFVNLSL